MGEARRRGAKKERTEESRNRTKEKKLCGSLLLPEIGNVDTYELGESVYNDKDLWSEIKRSLILSSIGKGFITNETLDGEEVSFFSGYIAIRGDVFLASMILKEHPLSLAEYLRAEGDMMMLLPTMIGDRWVGQDGKSYRPIICERLESEEDLDKHKKTLSPDGGLRLLKMGWRPPL